MFRYVVTIAHLILFSSVTANAAPPPAQAIYQLEQNNPDHTFTATITIKNNTADEIQHWQLALTTIHPILAAKEGAIISQTGGYYVFSPKENIPAGGEFVFHLTGKSAIKNETDAPSSYFIVKNNPLTHVDSIIPLTATTILLPTPPENTYAHNEIKNQTAIEGNAITPTITLAQSLIIPLPAELKRGDGKFILQPDTAIIVDKNSTAALAAAEFFSQAIATPTNYRLHPIAQPIVKAPANAIVLTQQDADAKLGPEGYTLNVTPKNIIITATTSAGFFYGIQSLRQLLPPEIFANKTISNVAWVVPALLIRDYPRFGYRGLHLDVARHFIPVEQVKRLIDLMALHKLNRFQWHLTDDEGWRIEIKKYPALTSIGAWRGFNRVMTPALGSGAQTYGGYYSQQEIRDIVKYAQARHIIIIPEIDMPGHARALVMSLRDELIDTQDLSQYTSVQGFHDNVMSPCIESTYQVIDNIMTDVAALFPGDTIHVGSDEIPKGAWSASPRCQALMATSGIKNPNELQHYFLTRVQQIIQSKNKKMAGWEEVVQHGDLDPTTTIYSWTSEAAGLDAAKRGYPVIMMPAKYLYFDLAYDADPKEPGVYWAGYVDTFQTYTYQPIQTSWPDNISRHILGIEGALWSENINSAQRLDYLAFPKLLALAEVAWTPKERRNWINFAARVGQLHLKRLDQYGVLYRISLPGINPQEISQGTLAANNEFPGLLLRYTLNGTPPSSNSLLYIAPITISNSTLAMRAFNSMERGSRVFKSS
jgi:hexosaminidase